MPLPSGSRDVDAPALQDSMHGCPCCGARQVARSLRGYERQLPRTPAVAQEYAVCAVCDSWYATATPASLDLALSYPSDYYSFEARDDSGMREWLRGARARHVAVRPSVVGSVLCRLLGVPDGLAAFGRLGAAPTSRILDVGAGAGRLVRDLHAAGFHATIGCDPFGRDAAGPPRLVRGGLDSVGGNWDVIMYHHCLEHIDDPVAELRRAASALAVGGRVLVRVPLTDSDAADTYGDRWVQLDAPRHRVIPSAVGMRRLAAQVGLTILDEWRDSSAFQFWGSELYLRDIPLRSPEALPAAHFSAREMKAWAAQASILNASGRGDQGVFVLGRQAHDAAGAS